MQINFVGFYKFSINGITIRGPLRAFIHLIKRSINNHHLQKAKTNFNLVANDYNSDENSDNECRTKTDKPIFASLPSTVTIDPSAVKIYSLKTDLTDNTNAKVNTTVETEANITEKPTMPKAKANTFASIITGGRSSPNEQDSELIELMKLEVTEVQSQVKSPVHEDKPTEMDAKTFKRKRRIEFMTRPIVPKKSTTDIAVSDDGNNFVAAPESEAQNTEVTKVNDDIPVKSLYSNFVRGNVELPGATNQTNNEKLSEDAGSEELSKQKTEIGELRTIIESKLKFLCHGRPDVSAVQAIFIQFEVSVLLTETFVV